MDTKPNTKPKPKPKPAVSICMGCFAMVPAGQPHKCGGAR